MGGGGFRGYGGGILRLIVTNLTNDGNINSNGDSKGLGGAAGSIS